MLFFRNLTLLAAITTTAFAVPVEERRYDLPRAVDDHADPELRTIAATANGPRSISGRSGTSGAVEIVNKMDQPIYIWSVSDSDTTGGVMHTVQKKTGTYTEQWRVMSDGSGISVKISTSPKQDSVLQYEYTKTGDKLFWDMSSLNINSTSPIVQQGFAVTISDDSCETVTCAAGDATCAASYQDPNDRDTHACRANAAWVLTLG
ncbi:hypothetical protein N7462_010858 [Penicillium macrosclerotiorum]|uniref:uncharacterized protein n=1 Tax=Penicillium macrosclerotiorum TaxID=303699 RepID=UPI002548345D|nr:uncharacterized protein N7462_010858 [Penicillium macrosclerotiorum]KAJ5669788.1 hypothetical protein N7462_010858 [Penicillium macrosclerotiorum]